jgi:hypothetical protein
MHHLAFRVSVQPLLPLTIRGAALSNSVLGALDTSAIPGLRSRFPNGRSNDRSIEWRHGNGEGSGHPPLAVSAP